MVPYLEMGCSNFSCVRTEGSKGSLFRKGCFQGFSVWELKVPMVPYLEMDVPIVFCLVTEGSNCFLFGNGWFQWFSV